MNVQTNDGSAGADRDHLGGAGELTVEVFSPRVLDPKKFIWAKSHEVGKAADEAARAFRHEAGTPTFQNQDKKVLRREKCLIEEGVRDFDQLELTDQGGGV